MQNQKYQLVLHPKKYFLEKIVKDKFDINVMVKAGSSPHTYEPKKHHKMKSLSNSKIYFYTGIEFEKAWLDKFKKSAPNTLLLIVQLILKELLWKNILMKKRQNMKNTSMIKT